MIINSRWKVWGHFRYIKIHQGRNQARTGLISGILDLDKWWVINQLKEIYLNSVILILKIWSKCFSSILLQRIVYKVDSIRKRQLCDRKEQIIAIEISKFLAIAWIPKFKKWIINTKKTVLFSFRRYGTRVSNERIELAHFAKTYCIVIYVPKYTKNDRSSCNLSSYRLWYIVYGLDG